MKYTYKTTDKGFSIPTLKSIIAHQQKRAIKEARKLAKSKTYPRMTVAEAFKLVYEELGGQYCFELGSRITKIRALRGVISKVDSAVPALYTLSERKMIIAASLDLLAPLEWDEYHQMLNSRS